MLREEPFWRRRNVHFRRQASALTLRHAGNQIVSFALQPKLNLHPGESMPTKLDRIVFGESKSIDFEKFNIGAVVKAVAFDLEEFETKGVQGLAVKTDDAKRTITYCEAARLKQPYIQAGVFKNDMILVVRDKKNDKFEEMAVLVKNYTP